MGRVHARHYFVSAAGDDSFSGTIEAPFKTISMAAKLAAAGDSVFVREGVYKERLRPQNSGQAGKYILFSNYENEKVVIDAQDQRQGVMLWRVSYIWIRGFTVMNAIHSGIHIHHHLEEEDNGSDYNIIEGNIVRRCGAAGNSGIYAGGNQNAIHKNIVSENGRITEENPMDHGIYILGSNNKVSDNAIMDNALSGIRMEGENNVVERNTIRNNGDFGLTVYVDAPLKGRNIRISNNLFIDNKRGGISIYGQGSGEKPSRIQICNNTIVSRHAEFGLRILRGARHVTVFNNIISGDYRRAFIKTDAESTQGYEEDYTIFFGKGRYGYKGILYDDLSAYQKVSSGSRNSITANPLLGSDFMPLTGSPAINTGKDIGLPFTGPAPDRGAKGSLTVN